MYSAEIVCVQTLSWDPVLVRALREKRQSKAKLVPCGFLLKKLKIGIQQVSVWFYSKDRTSVYVDHLARARRRVWHLKNNFQV